MFSSVAMASIRGVNHSSRTIETMAANSEQLTNFVGAPAKPLFHENAANNHLGAGFFARFAPTVQGATPYS
jgi:hypothetical protein